MALSSDTYSLNAKYSNSYDFYNTLTLDSLSSSKLFTFKLILCLWLLKFTGLVSGFSQVKEIETGNNLSDNSVPSTTPSTASMRDILQGYINNTLRKTRRKKTQTISPAHTTVQSSLALVLRSLPPPQRFSHPFHFALIFFHPCRQLYHKFIFKFFGCLCNTHKSFFY